LNVAAIRADDRKQLSMSTSPEVNLWNVTWIKDGGPTEDQTWLLCFTALFGVGLVANVLVAYVSTRWWLLRSHLRHFRSVGDAVIGQYVSGALSSCCVTWHTHSWTALVEVTICGRSK